MGVEEGSRQAATAGGRGAGHGIGDVSIYKPKIKHGVVIPFCGIAFRNGVDLFPEVHERKKAKGPALAGLF